MPRIASQCDVMRVACNNHRCDLSIIITEHMDSTAKIAYEPRADLTTLPWAIWLRAAGSNHP